MEKQAETEKYKERLKAVFQKLTAWFQENRRPFPFRDDPTPYHVYVSEIMLQQTRMNTVIPYYERFIRAIPDLKALSLIPDDELMKYWEGLGYYSRVRNMKKAAIQCMEEFGGRLPETAAELVKLPGIGAYTSAAIASIACDEQVPVVDGNVLRILSRFLGSERDNAFEDTKKYFRELLREAFSETEERASVLNPAMMELGEVLCLPNTAPLCENCPWKGECSANLTGRIEELPVRSAAKEKKTEHMTVFILQKENETAIRKNVKKGLLNGLYSLPYAEGILDEEKAAAYLKENGVTIRKIEPVSKARHVFSHKVWEMTAYLVDIENIDREGNFGDLIFATKEELSEKYALPTAFKKWDILKGEK